VQFRDVPLALKKLKVDQLTLPLAYPSGDKALKEAMERAALATGFVNAVSPCGADFGRTVGIIGERLGMKPAVIQLPIGMEGDYQGVIDLVEERARLRGGEIRPAMREPSSVNHHGRGLPHEYPGPLMNRCAPCEASAACFTCSSLALAGTTMR